jgi:Fe-S-cluster containining protein
MTQAEDMTLAATPQVGDQTISVNVELSGPDWSLRTTLLVPKEPIAPERMLPLFFLFADAVVGSAAKSVEQSGENISCKKGCGACCRQLVPISETEARWIHDIIERLPSGRRTEIRTRFAEARRRLSEAGLLDQLLHPETWTEGEGWSIAMSYFRLGIPCPFLENESCSIHADRPVKCREYLVTSPAEHCRKPTANTIKMVDLPFRVWTAMARLNNDSSTGGKIPWVPLVLALEWTDNHPQQPVPRYGHEVLQRFFEILSRKSMVGEQSSVVESRTDLGERK